jgi:diacylglycerol kinase (ATP)
VRDIILIYNPKAGDTYFRFSLDRFIEVFSEKEYEIRVFRSRRAGDMAAYLEECDLSLTQAIFIAGGNGSINEVVNAMMRIGSKIPIGVIPAGVENDFAKSLGFGADLEENLKALAVMDAVAVDVARVNDQYFVNLCSAGTFTSLTNVSSDMKNTFGRLAYYVKGLGALTKIRKMNLHIETEQASYEGVYAFLMLINAKIQRERKDIVGLTDGKYDLLAIKNAGIADIARIFLKVIKREPIDNKNALHLQGDYFKISAKDCIETIETEVDGEKGPSLPLEVKVYRGALNFFINK